MASNTLKPTLLRNLVKRGYAAQAAAQQSAFSLPPQEAKVTSLSNGAVVASLENNSPVSRVALLFKAGSRYESALNRGASHTLRSCVGLGTKNKSAFSITRTLQQAGGALTCETGREHIFYGLDIIRDDLNGGLEILAEVGTQPGFKAWELADNLYRLKDEIATLDPSTTAMELLHSAAFRNSGLGNSVYVPEHMIGSLTADKLDAFFTSTHTTSRMAIVGLGVEHDVLVSLAGSLGISSESGISGAAAYGGGEVRQDTGSPVTVVAVAGAGASLGSSDAAALAVAQQILGTGAHTKKGANSSSVLSSAVASSGGIGSATAINANYTDAGLFGYFVIADSGSVGRVVSAVHNAVKNLTVTNADLAAAKNRVKAAILMATEASGVAVEDMGLQALLTGGYVNPIAAAAAIDSVTAGSVTSAISKVMGGKLSMSAVGSLSEVPYLDQL